MSSIENNSEIVRCVQKDSMTAAGPWLDDFWYLFTFPEQLYVYMYETKAVYLPHGFP